MGKNSNFLFLKEHWAFLLQDAQQVESYALRDPAPLPSMLAAHWKSLLNGYSPMIRL